ncbi:MAG: hypothetical protein HXX16_20470 [Bacteroidales bacterium]|nr:hypothetical protein [Bacteroidales bacterium]
MTDNLINEACGKTRVVFGIESTDNCPHVFRIGEDNTLYLTWRNPKGEWSGWMPDWNNAPKMLNIFGFESTDNCPHMFGIGTDSTLYLSWRNKKGEWSGWMANWSNAPKMIDIFGFESTDNCPHMFGIGTDNTVYLNWRNPKGEWSGWMANWNNAPKMKSTFGFESTDNCPHMFGIGTDNTVYLNWRNAQGAWSGWMANWSNASKMLSVFGFESTDNCPHMFGIGIDNTLYLNWRDKKGQWSGWMSNWNNAPKMVSINGFESTDNCPHMFGIGIDNTVYLNWRNPQGIWSGWMANWNNAPKLKSVFSIETTDNCPHVFAIGTDNTLYLNWRDKKGQWSGWIANWGESSITTQNVFSGGYYNLNIPGLGWAQHTYVIANFNTPGEVKFPCYGGTDTARKLAGSKYPETLYKPQITPPYTQYGNRVEGDLWLARAIACGDVNAAPRNNYDSHWGGKYTFGDCCGLAYAIHGVCHHMEARILWSCNNTPILWPPTATASYWVWMDLKMVTGFYGNTWFIWKPIFEKMKKTPHLTTAFDEIDFTALMRQSLQEKIDYVDHPDFSAALGAAMATTAGDIQKVQQFNAVPDRMLKFHQFKNELDKQLLKGTVSKQEYADQLNKMFKQVMLDFANVLDTGSHQNLFGIAPAAEVELGINPALIPDNFSDFKLKF